MNCWLTPDPAACSLAVHMNSHFPVSDSPCDRQGIVASILFTAQLQINRYTPLHEKLQGGVLLPNERLIYA